MKPTLQELDPSIRDSIEGAVEAAGRYQADFDFDGATFVNCRNENGSVFINEFYAADTAFGTSSSTSRTDKRGVRITPRVSGRARIKAITFTGETATKGYIGNATSGTTVVDIVGGAFEAELDIVSGQPVDITVDNLGAAFTDINFNRNDFPVAFKGFDLTAAIYGTTTAVNTVYAIQRVEIEMLATSGTVTKLVRPSILKKWGNVKWQEETPAGTSIVADVLDASDNVLKAGVKSIADISDIDVSSHPTLKVRWTLSRADLNTQSPVLKNTSVVWEGGDEWKKISDVVIAESGISTIRFDSLAGYKRLRLTIMGKCVTNVGGRGDLLISVNDVPGNKHNAYSAYLTSTQGGTTTNLSDSMRFVDVALDAGYWRDFLAIVNITHNANRVVVSLVGASGNGNTFGAGYLNADVTEIENIKLSTYSAAFPWVIGTRFILEGSR